VRAGGARESPVDSATVPARRGDFVQSLERGLAVIKAFGPHRTRLTLTEVAQATGLNRAAARRFLHTLAELDYVRVEGRDFSLRPTVLELGYAYLAGLGVPEIARPFMEALCTATQESSSMAVLDDNEIVYVANVTPRRAMTINVTIGARDPAHCTSLGRVLLAFRTDDEIRDYLETVPLRKLTDATLTKRSRLLEALELVRERGYALIDHEFEEGLVAVAVPIHDGSGNVVAALNISAYSLRASIDVLEHKFLPLLRDHAQKIEIELRSLNSLGGS
jgi:IclR family pca regulon transcriptional regulator